MLGSAAWEIVFGKNRFSSDGWQGPTSLTVAVFVRVKVAEIFSNHHGKNPVRFSRSIYMEYGQFLPFVVEQPLSILTDDRKSKLAQLDYYGLVFISNLNDSEHAETVVVNIPPSYRMQFYVSSDYDEVQGTVTEFASLISYVIGFTRTRQSLPVLRYYSRYSSL